MIGDLWPLVEADTMRALDRYTIEDLGVTGEVLMESAGRAVVEIVLRERAALDPSGEVVVVCGAGNNGGDGLVVARHLQALAIPVRAVLLADPARFRGDAAANLARARAFGVALGEPPFEAPLDGVVVDAIFGTGLQRPVEGEAAETIQRINASRPDCRVVAVDLPSGLDADTGQVRGPVVEADVTVTIGLPKLGLALEPGRTLAGRIWVARIGIADEAPGVDWDAALWTPMGAGLRLPERPRDGHKGRFGHVLVVAGSQGKTGAAALTARGALRGGAGLVTIACPAGLNDILEVKCTEAMTVPVADTAERSFASAAEDALIALAEARDVVALGPGIGESPETAALVRALCKRLERPLVLDADGLNAFAGSTAELRAREQTTILTPHPGEAARLLDVATAEIAADRIGAARRLADETQSVVLLKGAASIVAAPGERAIVIPTGGPALASGGTGDVLTGVVAALLAQGLEAQSAAALAAYLHGLAGDRIAGDFGLAAQDLADAIPAAAASLRVRAREGPAVVDGTSLVLSFPEP